MRVKKLISVLFCVAAAALSCCLVACGETKTPPPAVETYALSYASGDEAATGTAPETKRYAAGTRVTLAKGDVFSLTGHTFTFWNDGATDYAAEGQFVMPENDVVMTAKWKDDSQTPGGDDNPPEKDEPTTAELGADFYDAENWVYMTNNDGASVDGGDIPYSLADGSIKFHRLNQAIELGDKSNGTMSFMLKGTNDWSFWFNSSGKDNNNNYSYRLAYAYGGLRLVVSSAPEQAAALIVETNYAKGEWNRFDIVCATADKVAEIKVYVNGKRAKLTAGDNTSPAISVAENVLTHTQPELFVTGEWVAVKVWNAHNYVQIKPVSAASEEDVPIIACVGASITEGAGAGNFYTESYPAQLQNALGGDYNVVNLGNSGKTVRDVKADNGVDDAAWLKQDQWTGFRAIVPDMAIINIGTNDSKTTNDPPTTTENFTEAYEDFIEHLLSVNPDMELYICTVPYAYSSIYGISNDNIRDIIAPVQRTVAQEGGHTLIDLYEYTQNKSQLFGDGIHPNTTGYAMFVEIIKEVLLGDGTLSDDFLADIDARYNDAPFEVTSASIEETEGKIMLTVTGSSGDPGIRLYVGDGKTNDFYTPITVGSDDSFTATYDLATLPSGGDWFNVRIYYTSGTYYTVTLTDAGVESGDSFTSTDKKITVHTWGSADPLSLSVADFDSSYTITTSNITITNGKLVMTGVATGNVTSLRVVLCNDKATETDTDISYVDVTIGQDGAFTAEVDLAPLTVNNRWYYLWTIVNGGSRTKVAYNKTDEKYYALDKLWRWEYWEGIAVACENYTGPTVTLTTATIEQKEGGVILTLAGTLSLIADTYESTLLYIGNNANEQANYHAVTTGDNNTFTATFDLATLALGSGIQVRLYHSRTDSDALWGYYTLKIPEVTVIADGSEHPLALNDKFTVGNKRITVLTSATSWNPIDFTVADATVSVAPSSIAFDNGDFVLTGTAANVDHLYVYLINTNVAGSENNYVDATITDGTFTARLPLDTLLSYVKTGTPFNIRYKINDVTTGTTNVSPDGLDMTQIYRSGKSLFYLGTNNGCAAVYYRTDPYGLTAAEITVVNGRATLVLEGIADALTDMQYYLLLDENGSGTGMQKILAENKSATAGTFRFEVDISALESSTEISASNGAACRHYYIRLYKGVNLTAENYTTGSKVEDINSRWLADRLFQTVNVVGDSSDYAFIKNSTNNNYYTLGIVRVGKDATAVKLGDISAVSLGYYARDSVSVTLADYVDAKGTVVTYTVSSSDPVVTAAENNGILTVTASGLSGSATVTVTVLSDGERAFDLSFTVTVSDEVMGRTNNYDSFLTAASWLDILNDGNDAARFDTYTNSVLFQWGNWYQQIGASNHISFELWVNGSGDYGFEIWFRSTTNDKNVAGNKYIMNGYGESITISREDGTAIASFPRFAAGTFTRFDITLFDVYESETLVKTIVNIYINGQKVALTGSAVSNGSIVDNAPIAASAGIYFAIKSWAPQIAVRTAAVLPDPDAVRVAAVGDSTTYGHSWHSESYPVYLATDLGDGYYVENFGLNGASVTGFGGSSLKYSAQQQYSDSVAFAPDVIVIMLGANDANNWAQAQATYESELRALVAAYRTAFPKAKILLVTSAPTLEGNQYAIPNDVIEANINPVQRAVAQDLGLTLVDLHNEMKSDQNYNDFFRADGVHLSVTGAQFVANVISTAIKALA